MWLPLMCPNWGPGPQPRHVTWLGIELVILRFKGQYWIHWATAVRLEAIPNGVTVTNLTMLTKYLDESNYTFCLCLHSTSWPLMEKTNLLKILVPLNIHKSQSQMDPQLHLAISIISLICFFIPQRLFQLSSYFSSPEQMASRPPAETKQKW